MSKKRTGESSGETNCKFLSFSFEQWYSASPTFYQLHGRQTNLGNFSCVLQQIPGGWKQILIGGEIVVLRIYSLPKLSLVSQLP